MSILKLTHRLTPDTGKNDDALMCIDPVFLAREVATVLGCKVGLDGLDESRAYLYSNDHPYPWGVIHYNSTEQKYRVYAYSIVDKRSGGGDEKHSAVTKSRLTARKIALAHVRKMPINDTARKAWEYEAVYLFNAANAKLNSRVYQANRMISSNDQVVDALVHRYYSGDTFSDNSTMHKLLSECVAARNEHAEHSGAMGKKISFVQVVRDALGRNVFHTCTHDSGLGLSPAPIFAFAPVAYAESEVPEIIMSRVAALTLCAPNTTTYVDLVGARISENTFFACHD